MDISLQVRSYFLEKERLTIDCVEIFLKSLKITKEDIDKYLLQPKELEYGRYTLFYNEHVEVCILNWVKGSKSKIHDHGNSDCSMLVIEGILANKNYKLNDQEELVEVFTNFNKREDVVSISNTEIHGIEQVEGDAAITLHVYYPPIEKNKIFSP